MRGMWHAQMSEVVRLSGQSSDADACGLLVWAETDGSIWWPAEALDPHDMPPGRPIPPAALSGQASAIPTLAASCIALVGCVSWYVWW